MPVPQRVKDVWLAVRLAYWVAATAVKGLLVWLGLRRPPARAADLRFPLLMIAPGRPAPVVETSLDGLRRNPLGVSATEKVVLIAADGEIYTQSNVRQRGATWSNFGGLSS